MEHTYKTCMYGCSQIIIEAFIQSIQSMECIKKHVTLFLCITDILCGKLYPTKHPVPITVSSQLKKSVASLLPYPVCALTKSAKLCSSTELPAHSCSCKPTAVPVMCCSMAKYVHHGSLQIAHLSPFHLPSFTQKSIVVIHRVLIVYL